jgi:ABC-type transport system involved in multi-copper enzyme maturation permease subunit
MIRIILKKEISEELHTWKGTLWLVITSLIFSLTTYLLLTDKELSLLDHAELLWLFSKIIISVAVLIVSIESSMIINSEFEKETAESLFLSPLSYIDFVTGKLLAILTLWGAIYAVAFPYILVTSKGTKLTWPFLGYVALWGTLGALFLAMFIIAISFLTRSSKNTLTIALVVLLGLMIPALFSSTLKISPAVSFIAGINPLDNMFSSLDNVLVDYKTSLWQNLNFLMPVLLWGLLALLLLILSVRIFKKQGIIKNS